MERTTLCYIRDKDCYLLLHRVKKKNDANQDKWIGIGGHFEAGETPEECIRRETMEETGLTLTELRFRGVVDFCSDRWPEEWMYLFTSDSYEGFPKECNEGELVWIPMDHMRDLNFWEGDYIFLDLLLKEEWPGILCKGDPKLTKDTAYGAVPAGCFNLKLTYEGEKLTDWKLE